MRRWLVLLVVLGQFAPGAIQIVSAENGVVPVVFMEPESGGAEHAAPTYKSVTDAARMATLRGWMDNDAGQMALQMYKRAWHTMQKRGQAETGIPPYHIALVPGGNHADSGFRLKTQNGLEDHLDEPYIKLAPKAQAFDITFAHETGHVVLGILSGGKGVPKGRIASIPHTTSALTGRATAFNEGFAIHIETLIAHTSSEAAHRAFYHHGRFPFGDPAQKASEYHRAGMDLRSYSQTLARYHEVRENTYAFASPYDRGDYLRIQLDKARDYATLRDANQLLQSEGFYATFFFGLTMRGAGLPDDATIAERQDRMFDALADMLAAEEIDEHTPFLLRFVTHYMERHPSDGRAVVDVLMDLSHGVFVDAQAADLWRDYYLGGIRLDIKGPIIETIEEARKRWRAAVLADPSILESRIGPQLPCRVPGVSVRLVYFRQNLPLSFDINTVQPGVIRLVPGITDEEVSRWIKERAERPFSNESDFTTRVTLAPAVAAKLRFLSD